LGHRKRQQQRALSSKKKKNPGARPGGEEYVEEIFYRLSRYSSPRELSWARGWVLCSTFWWSASVIQLLAEGAVPSARHGIVMKFHRGWEQQLQAA
jgi:hypothetical protein